MKAYLDTSVLLRILLGEHGAFADLAELEEVYSSRLVQTESKRVLHRLAFERRIDEQDFAEINLNLDRVLMAVSLVQIDERVLARAEEPFAAALGTLDAIHLSTALLLRARPQLSALSFLTHDERLAKAAMISGFQVYGV